MKETNETRQLRFQLFQLMLGIRADLQTVSDFLQNELQTIEDTGCNVEDEANTVHSSIENIQKNLQHIKVRMNTLVERHYRGQP